MCGWCVRARVVCVRACVCVCVGICVCRMPDGSRVARRFNIDSSVERVARVVAGLLQRSPDGLLFFVVVCRIASVVVWFKHSFICF